MNAVDTFIIATVRILGEGRFAGMTGYIIGGKDEDVWICRVVVPGAIHDILITSDKFEVIR